MFLSLVIIQLGVEYQVNKIGFENVQVEVMFIGWSGKKCIIGDG